MDKIWTNSGDSHSMEPPDLYRSRMPSRFAERMPRTEIADGQMVTYIDGKTITRRIPGGANLEMMEAMRAQGTYDNSKRLADLDDQGVWGEVIFPSLGLWYGEIESTDLADAAAEVLNDWVAEDLIARSPRFVPCATLPLQSIESSVAEVERCAAKGFQAVFLPTKPPVMHGHWNAEEWEPLWDVLEGTGTVLAFHIGTESGEKPQKYPRPGRGDDQLRQHHLRRTDRGVDDDRARRARTAPRPQGPRIGGRRDLGTLPRRPDERGLPPAPHVQPGRGVDAPEGVHQPSGVRALPARRDRGAGDDRHGLRQRDVGQRLPPPRRHVPAHPEGASRAVRRRRRRRRATGITIGAFLDLFPSVGRPPAA